MSLDVCFKILYLFKLAPLLHTVSNSRYFLVSGLKDEKLIKSKVT